MSVSPTATESEVTAALEEVIRADWVKSLRDSARSALNRALVDAGFAVRIAEPLGVRTIGLGSGWVASGSTLFGDWAQPGTLNAVVDLMLRVHAPSNVACQLSFRACTTDKRPLTLVRTWLVTESVACGRRLRSAGGTSATGDASSRYS
jgi:hypothetical protein